MAARETSGKPFPSKGPSFLIYKRPDWLSSLRLLQHQHLRWQHQHLRRDRLWGLVNSY